MQRTDATWADVEPGAFVVSPAGEVYKVLALDKFEDTVTFTDRDRNVFTSRAKPLDTPVTMAVPTFEEAIATVQQVLGGQVLTEDQ